MCSTAPCSAGQFSSSHRDTFPSSKVGCSNICDVLSTVGRISMRCFGSQRPWTERHTSFTLDFSPERQPFYRLVVNRVSYSGKDTWTRKNNHIFKFSSEETLSMTPILNPCRFPNLAYAVAFTMGFTFGVHDPRSVSLPQSVIRCVAEFHNQ